MEDSCSDRELNFISGRIGNRYPDNLGIGRIPRVVSGSPDNSIIGSNINDFCGINDFGSAIKDLAPPLKILAAAFTSLAAAFHLAAVLFWYAYP